MTILTLNAGSATIKFAAFTRGDIPACILSGTVDGIGSKLTLETNAGKRPIYSGGSHDHKAALEMILAFLREHDNGDFNVSTIGHRIVHGGTEFVTPALLTRASIKKLEALAPFAPLHQMHNLAGIEAAGKAFPDAVQYGCFDTAFHRAKPKVSDTFALPGSYFDEGVRRYGFHGLSFEHIRFELGDRCRDKRIVIAHLGNGASLCALKDGRPVDTTMGFSPLDGMPMGTRCGQIDPGVLLYMMQQKKMTPDDIQRLLYHQSGLKGLSGISSDMRVLLDSDEPAARLAVDYFCHHARREIAAMTASLSGVDILVFTGGIGENAWRIRKDICAGLNWLGLKLDNEANRDKGEKISSHSSQVEVLVIPTNEELTIARSAGQFIR